MTLLCGDCLEHLAQMPENSVDSVVSDPPYHFASIVKRFGAAKAAPAKVGATGAYERASRGFMGHCFHPDTDVMTSEGWKRVGDLGLGEVIATLNPSTREMEWQAVAQTHRYDFDGDLIHVHHRSAEQLVTPNHRVLLSVDGGDTLRLVEAAKLPSTFHLFAQAKPVAGRRDAVQISSARDYGKDRAATRAEYGQYEPSAFFRFFGLWLGDGYTVTRTNDHPANDFFGLRVKKTRKIKAIRQALKELGIRFTETTGADDSHFYCYDFCLLEWLKTLGSARTKHIPTWLFAWDASLLEHLYTGLMDTDGSTYAESGQEVFSTSSARLADDFQRLCLHVGRSTALKHRPGGKTVVIQGHKTVSNASWACCVLQPGKRMYGTNGGSNSNVVSRKSYRGEVVCVGVERHHIIFTRFNGRPVWSGNSWDGGDIAFRPETWAAVMRVLKPGGHLLAFGSSKGAHRMICAIEDAGFEIRDTIMWLYGTGFPKSHDVALSIDKASRGVPHGGSDPTSPNHGKFKGGCSDDNALGQGFGAGPGQFMQESGGKNSRVLCAEAAAWEGWGTALKPAFEPIVMARKPLIGTVAANVLAHGTGAINIDACRVPADNRPLRVGDYKKTADNVYEGRQDGSLMGGSKAVGTTDLGRFPANVLHDGSDEVVSAFPNSNGQQGKVGGQDPVTNVYGDFGPRPVAIPRGDSGSAARFFWSPKASKADRADSKHPTVKPVALMRYLCRLVTPPGGVVMDPFAGTGTTGQAALAEGFNAILIEREAEYQNDIRRRLGLLQPAENVFG
ncbi:methylase [EBPR siphovirus 2]|nr:methylase [EBPR siphovirus 2]